MSLPQDQFGRTVTMVTQNGQDVYTADDGHGNKVSVSFPAGSPQSDAYNSLNGQAPPGYVPPTLPLNQQYTPKEFGQYLVQQLNDANGARNLTSDQNLQMATLLSPYFILANIGDLQTLVAELPKIPVDGVLITQPMIDQFVGALQAYLAGE